MNRGYVGYRHATLARLLPVSLGERVLCPACGECHPVIRREEGEAELYVSCRDRWFLAGVAGRLVLGIAPDVVGEEEGD